MSLTETTPPIETLTDFPALQQLGRALWHQSGERGAAAMVGAGFSLNARMRSQDARKPPLWRHLADDMARQLYGDDGEAPSDALRLAEEYRTYFGQAALNDFIRERIADTAWEPGVLHHALVDLPWSDILTTNYDTLIERAAEDVTGRTYQPIRTEGDLARFAAPRVMKLHGTIGVDDSFIIAEDDFRTYPARHAAFVNAARQVFVENELCLFGFSGDDPNFLAWSGWVRDHLGGNARRIYLVGVLNLEPARRKFLEARNIAPIDLAPLAAGLDRQDRDARALGIALDFLKSMRPTPRADWRPVSIDEVLGTPQIDDNERERKEPGFAARRLKAATAALKSDREDYPGWLVAPSRVRDAFRWQTDKPPHLTGALAEEIGPEMTAAYLREIGWRHRVGYLELNKWEALRLAKAVALPDSPGLSRADRLDLALDLARHARETGDVDALRTWIDFVRAGAELESDLRAAAEYELCLNARDQLDLSTLATLVDGVSGPDPAWSIRAAGLLCELGEYARAKRLIEDTIKDLRRRKRSSPASLWLLSRLAWAEWFSRALKQDEDWVVQSWPNAYKDAKADPFDLLGAIKSELHEQARKQRENQREVVPAFEPGAFKNNRNAVRFVSRTVSSPLYQIRRLLEDAGVPVRLRSFNLASETLLDALEHNPTSTAAWNLSVLRAVRSKSNSAYVTHFSRIAIARMTDETVEALLDRLFAVVAYWRGAALRQERASAHRDHMPLLLETIGRLSLRAKPRQAAEAFLLAVDLGKDRLARHHSMMEPLARLVSGALEGMPSAMATGFLQEILAFPLASEAEVSSWEREWPSAAGWLELVDWSEVQASAGARRRADALIDAMSADSTDRVEACLRAFRLHENGFLTSEQSRRFGEALWGKLDDLEPPLPKDHGLYLIALVDLPHPPDVDVRDRVSRRLYGPDAPDDRLDRIQEIRSAAHVTREKPLLPDNARIARLFDQATAWRPAEAKEDFEGLGAALRGEGRNEIGLDLGILLGVAVAPALAEPDRTQKRLDSLLKLIATGSAPHAMVALPYFSRLPGGEAHVVTVLRQALLSDDFTEVASACDALVAWAMRSELALPPSPLVDQLVVLFEARRLPNLHPVARGLARLAGSGLLDGTVERVRQALENLRLQTAYDQIELGGWDAVTVSLVRAECVHLALALERRFGTSEETQRFVQEGLVDPLPEVRRAARGDTGD